MNWDAIAGKTIESEITLLSQGSSLKGNLTFDTITRIHGRIEGNVIGLPGSLIVVGETGSIHGEIDGDEIIVDGFVHGKIKAKTKVSITESGRVIGDVTAPKFEVKFGAHFEGKAITAPALASAANN